MVQVIDAIYEQNAFRPIRKVDLPDKKRVTIVVYSEDTVPVEEDLPTWALLRLAEGSPSYAFLDDPGEDIYSLNDGEPLPR